MKIFISFLIFLSGLSLAYCQEFNLNFANSIGNFNDNYSYDMISDKYGNTYITGTFKGILDFGGKTLNCNGTADIFIAKFDTNGFLIWANRAGGETDFYEQGSSISIDSNGNCYLTGSFKGTSTFGDTTLYSYNNSQDAFIVKYDSLGNLMWVKQIGGSKDDTGSKVILNQNNEFYFAGLFGSDTIKFDNIDIK